MSIWRHTVWRELQRNYARRRRRKVGVQQLWALDMRAGVKTKTDHDEYCHEIRVMS